MAASRLVAVEGRASPSVDEGAEAEGLRFALVMACSISAVRVRPKEG